MKVRLPLTLKESFLQKKRERIKELRRQYQPRALPNGHLVRDKTITLNPQDFATMQKPEMTTAANRLKRFYQFNLHSLPLVHKFIPKKQTFDGESMHIFRFPQDFQIYITKHQDSQCFARLYYIDRTHMQHHIATASISTQIFTLYSPLQKSLSQAIAGRKFRIATHQLETEIPI